MNCIDKKIKIKVELQLQLLSSTSGISQYKGTKLIGTIQREDEKDEDSLLEVAYG